MTDIPGVTELLDGGFDFDPTLLSCVRDDPDASARRLGVSILPDRLSVPVLAFLLDLPAGPVLVDAGAGTLLGPGFGRVADGLAAAGLTPGDITAVALTHLHGDHCGGLIRNNAPAYPEARILVSTVEIAFWAETPPTGYEAGIAADAERVLGICAEGLSKVKPGWRGFGLEAVAAPGHTPGHTAWSAPSLAVLACGDIWHVPWLQIERPDCRNDWDMDHSAAARTRRDLVAQAAHANHAMLCAHAGIVPPGGYLL